MTFRALKIRSQLMLGFGCLVLLIAGLGGYGYLHAEASNRSMRTVFEDRVVPLKQLSVVSGMYAVKIIDAANKVAAGLMPAKSAVADLDVASQRVASEWKAYTETVLVEAEKRGVAAVRPLMTAAEPSIGALRQAMVADDKTKVSALLKELYERIDPISAEIEKLIDVQQTEAKAEFERSQAEFKQGSWVFLSLILVAAGMGAVLAWRLAGAIAGPIDRAAALARAVAAGDLSQQVVVEGSNEAAQLLMALKDMQAGLSRMVVGVRENSDSVATASAQIAQGNLDLSRRTEEQASALQQTAATMSVLGSTVRHNADNAKQANSLAQGASGIAAQGGVVVSQVVTTMRGINDSSRKIGEITGVIDAIAFQTNILALNAAVEAARAGEQGRGFAVVASEVRSLAQRSAAAAKEIKTLIGQSVLQVEQGGQLANQAGQTMTDIVGSIQRVSAIVAEIAAASIEQNVGVQQVSDAVGKMDSATQQNAALVEQSAAAADSLKGQAQQLVHAVSAFTLDGKRTYL